MVFLLLDVFRVFGSGFFLLGVFLVRFVFWTGLGMVFAYFVLLPPRSVSALVWVIGLLISSTGCVSRVVAWVQVALGVFRVIFLLGFSIHFSLFHASSSPRPPHPVAGDMAMLFVDDLFLPLKAWSSFHITLRTLPASLPCRSEVWEWV